MRLFKQNLDLSNANKSKLIIKDERWEDGSDWT